MGNKMTVRLSDEEKNMLEQLAEAFTCNGVQSKAVRLSIAFTNACLKQIKEKDYVYSWKLMEKFNKKFNTDINDWRYH